MSTKRAARPKENFCARFPFFALVSTLPAPFFVFVSFSETEGEKTEIFREKVFAYPGKSVDNGRKISYNNDTEFCRCRLAVWRQLPKLIPASSTLVTCSKKGRLPCEGVLFWRKTTTDESRGWSCERERAFCPIGIFFRNTPRQNKQHSVLFGGARRQRRDSRHLLQKRRLPHGGVLFWRKTTISLLGSLVQRELAAIRQTEGLAVSVSELLIPSVTS